MGRLAAIGLIAAACSGGEPDDGPLDDGGFIVTPGMENQGTKLLGAGLDNLRGSDEGHHVSFALATAVRADGKPISLELGRGAALRSGSHRGKDPLFTGVVIQTGYGGEVEVTVADLPGGRDVAQYRLRVRGDDSSEWRDPCEGEAAVPIAGVWARTGTHEVDRSRVSFACADGTGHKCVRWGYVPGTDPAEVGWRAHQACTRMARADYCANGRSHTRTGTEIWIFDNLGIAAPPSSSPGDFDGIDRYPPSVSKPAYEAAWPIGDAPAACLARLRWQALPLHGRCEDGVTLPDPRDGIGAFCDDLGPEGAREPTLFNSSTYADLALHVWQRGDDRITTIRGFYDPKLPDSVRAPFPGAGEYSYVDTVEGLLLRKIPPNQPPEAFLEVKVFVDPATNDHVVARAEDRLPPTYEPLDGAAKGFEGYVRKDADNGGMALRMYRHPTTLDYWSTTDAAAAAAAGYTDIGLVGYVRPPES